MIVKVRVNYTERNYFNDYDEIRSDYTMFISEEKVLKAIDKLHRRYRDKGKSDVMFVTNDDGTGYRLMYDFVALDRPYELSLLHYNNIETNSWDTVEMVTLAEAKRRIVAG